MTDQEHNRLLAIFLYIQGGLQAFGGLLVAIIYGGMGVFFATAGSEPDSAGMAVVMVIVGIVVTVLTLAAAGFYLFTARKIQLGKPGGRTLGIIASVLCLLNMPLGTALGIYGLWFLAGERGGQFYSGVNEYSPVPPPPPASWQ